LTACSQSEEAMAIEKVVYDVSAEAIVKATVIDTYVAVGKFTPQKQVTLTSDLATKVIEIYVEEGSYVEKGSPLMRLDDEQVEIDYKLQKNQLDGQMSLLKSAYEDRLEKLNNAKALNDVGALSNEDLRMAQLEADQAYDDYTKAQNESKLYNSKFNTTLKDSIVSAPFNGYVTHIGIEENENNTGGGLITLSDTDLYHLEVYVPSTAAAEALLQTPLADNQVLLLGVTHHRPRGRDYKATERTWDTAFYPGIVHVPFAVKLTLYDGAFVSQLAIDSRGPLQQRYAKVELFLHSLGIFDAQKATAFSGVKGEAWVFPERFDLFAHLATIKYTCSADKCYDYDPSRLVTQRPPLAFQLKMGQVMSTTPGFGYKGNKSKDIMRISSPTPYRNDRRSTIYVDGYTKPEYIQGSLQLSTFGPESHLVAAQAKPVLKQYMVEEHANKKEQARLRRAIYNTIRYTSPSIALYKQCGSIPRGGAVGEFLSGSSGSAHLAKVRAYKPCAERVRASLDRAKYSIAFAKAQPLVKQFAELGGPVFPSQGGPGLQPKKLTIPHPDGIEIPIDEALATLAGEDFSYSHGNAAIERAEKQRKAAQVERMRQHRLAQAERYNAMIIQQAKAAQAAAQSSAGSSKSAITLTKTCGANRVKDASGKCVDLPAAPLASEQAAIRAEQERLNQQRWAEEAAQRRAKNQPRCPYVEGATACTQ